jgi:hypothetical protein
MVGGYAEDRQMLVLRASGVQAEARMPLAGLHQLLRPVLSADPPGRCILPRPMPFPLIFLYSEKPVDNVVLHKPAPPRNSSFPGCRVNRYQALDNVVMLGQRGFYHLSPTLSSNRGTARLTRRRTSGTCRMRTGWQLVLALDAT